MSLSGLLHRRKWARAARATVLTAVIVLSAVAVVYVGRSTRPAAGLPTINAFAVQVAPGSAALTEYHYDRLSGPARTVARNSAGAVVATFTDGARTAVLAGPARLFRASRATPSVISNSEWVRLIPQPWVEGAEGATWFRPWLHSALADRSPDVLAIALAYLDAGPTVPSDRTPVVRHDQSRSDSRKRPPDFYDYLGISWIFPDSVRRKPNPELAGEISSSGFVRLVFGYRAGYPMRSSDRPGNGLPRSALAMSQAGPGVPVVPDRVRSSSRYNVLQPGDLVFFDLGPDNGRPVDCVGMYVGMDSNGHRRFVAGRSASRHAATPGDGTPMLQLDDSGRFSQGFHSAKRI